MPIDALNRCCGPEEGMEYHNDLTNWERRIKHLCTLFEDGWDYPPLIAEYKSGSLMVRDGNHRHETMKRLGMFECWVIIWENDNPKNLTNLYKNTKKTSGEC